MKISVDVCVVGAAGGGLAAAVRAKELGAEKVIVLEKMRRIGGSSVRPRGMFAVNSPLQARHGCYYDVDKINVLGEFGGIGYPEPGHLWQKGSNWGYNGVKKDHEEVITIYEEFIKMLENFARTGCAAAVYTQTTDVEAEVNGIMTYDRKVIKMDEGRLRKANEHIIRTFGTF